MSDPAIVQDLPPLPEPDGSATRVVGHQQVETMTADVTAEVDAWSRELVEAYARTAVEAAISKEREACAELLEALETIAAQSSGIPGSTNRADCMAAFAAAAIRARE